MVGSSPLVLLVFLEGLVLLAVGGRRCGVVIRPQQPSTKRLLKIDEGLKGVPVEEDAVAVVVAFGRKRF